MKEYFRKKLPVEFEYKQGFYSLLTNLSDGKVIDEKNLSDQFFISAGVVFRDAKNNIWHRDTRGGVSLIDVKETSECFYPKDKERKLDKIDSRILQQVPVSIK